MVSLKHSVCADMISLVFFAQPGVVHYGHKTILISSLLKVSFFSRCTIASNLYYLKCKHWIFCNYFDNSKSYIGVNCAIHS